MKLLSIIIINANIVINRFQMKYCKIKISFIYSRTYTIGKCVDFMDTDIVTRQHAIQGMHVTLMPVILDMPVILITIVGNNCQPFLFPNSPWFFSPSCGAACCRPWDPHCHHWLHPCSPKAEKRFAQNMSSYLKSLAESYEHQADMIQRPRSKSMSDLEHITKSKK